MSVFVGPWVDNALTFWSIKSTAFFPTFYTAQANPSLAANIIISTARATFYGSYDDISIMSCPSIKHDHEDAALVSEALLFL